VRTKLLNDSSSMQLIMENWRGFVFEGVDLDKLDEECKHFWQTYDNFKILKESAQEQFLVVEGAFGEAWTRIKEIAAATKTSLVNLLEIFRGDGGWLWKAFKVVGWSLDTLGDMLRAGSKALREFQKFIFDYAQKNPFTADPNDKNRFGEWVDSLKERWFRAGAGGKGLKVLTVAIVFALLAGLIISGGFEQVPYHGDLLVGALAGNFTVFELLTPENMFGKLILSMAAGVAMNIVLPGSAWLTMGIIPILRKLVAMRKGGEWVIKKSDTAAGWAKKVAKKMGAPPEDLARIGAEEGEEEEEESEEAVAS